MKLSDSGSMRENIKRKTEILTNWQWYHSLFQKRTWWCMWTCWNTRMLQQAGDSPGVCTWTVADPGRDNWVATEGGKNQNTNGKPTWAKSFLWGVWMGGSNWCLIIARGLDTSIRIAWSLICLITVKQKSWEVENCSHQPKKEQWLSQDGMLADHLYTIVGM